MSNQVTRRYTLPCGRTVTVVEGDLLQESVDAIVNAANSQLAHGGGIAGAIARAAGPELQEDSRRAAPVPAGRAAATSAGWLPIKAVIHAVGPVYTAHDPLTAAKLLRSAVQSALTIASDSGYQSIAVPAISSGIFGYPVHECAQVIVHAVADYLSEHRTTTPLRDIRLVVMGTTRLTAFEAACDALFGPLSPP